MDCAATALEAYAIFCAPREGGDGGRPSSIRPPASPAAPRRLSPAGWLIGGFYGLILGAFSLGLTDSLVPRRVAELSAVCLLALALAQTSLLPRAAASVRARRVSQALAMPLVAILIAGAGALARLAS